MWVIIVFTIVILIYNWDKVYPVKIIDIHKESIEHAHIIVSHFPLTDNGKINWWLSNREFIKTYNTPSQSRYHIAIWDIGDGYMKDSYKEDFYCFSDMKVTKNCIEKFTHDNRQYTAG